MQSSSGCVKVHMLMNGSQVIYSHCVGYNRCVVMHVHVIVSIRVTLINIGPLSIINLSVSVRPFSIV